jgi:hypothetical protein
MLWKLATNVIILIRNSRAAHRTSLSQNTPQGNQDEAVLAQADIILPLLLALRRVELGRANSAANVIFPPPPRKFDIGGKDRYLKDGMKGPNKVVSLLAMLEHFPIVRRRMDMVQITRPGQQLIGQLEEVFVSFRNLLRGQ